MTLPATLYESMARVLAHLEAEGAIEPGDRESAQALVGRAVGAALWGLWHRINSLAAAVLPAGATGADLDAWGAAVGLSRGVAATARGGLLVLATDPEHEDTITIPQGTIWLGPLGQAYEADDTTFLLGGVPGVGIMVTATTPGAWNNLPVGATCSLAAPISGLQSAATVGVVPISGGADAEGDEAFRARILEAFRWPRGPSLQGAILAAARAVAPAVRRAWTATTAPGRGRVLLDTCQGYGRAPSADDVAAAKTAISAFCPPGVTWTVAAVAEKDLSLTVSVPGLASLPSADALAAKRGIADAAARYLADVPVGGTVSVMALGWAIRAAHPVAELVSPAADVACSEVEAPRLGTITWEG